MVDFKGLGKPYVFDGKEKSFSRWATKASSYVGAVFTGFEDVLEWSVGQEAKPDMDDVSLAFGPGGSEKEVENLDVAAQEVHMALL